MHPKNKDNSNKVYVCFDGDNDFNYFRVMQEWKRSHNINFIYAHGQNLRSLHLRGSEREIKDGFKKQIQSATAFVVLIGESTRYLSKYVYWEMEQAIALDKPIIGVNLNGLRYQDTERCPPIIIDKLAVHISFNAIILQEALVTWPMYHATFRQQGKSGPRYYNQSHYAKLGL